MRLGILAAAPLLMLLSAGCTRRDPIKPTQPAVQIIIPDAPGWSPSTNDNQIYAAFEGQLRERIRASQGVIKTMTWQQRDLATVVTLYGEHPGQILTIAMPFLNRAGLPAGVSVTKYDGAGGEREEPVRLGSQALS